MSTIKAVMRSPEAVRFKRKKPSFIYESRVNNYVLSLSITRLKVQAASVDAIGQSEFSSLDVRRIHCFVVHPIQTDTPKC